MLVRADLLGTLLAIAYVCCPQTGASAQGTAATVDIGPDATVSAPAEFDLQGRWTVVPDPTARNGLALQSPGLPENEDLSTLAIYKPAFPKDAEISVRLRTDGGRSDPAAGIVVRLNSPQDYYLIQMDARRNEIVFSRIKDGTSEEIADVDAEVTSHDWHTLSVSAIDNEFTVSFDGKWAFTGFDRALSQPGYIALWAKGDSVTRFDNVAIKPLASHEER